MAIYRYIYYTILFIYKRFSRDPQIGIFALGFFTVVISFNILSIVSIYEYYVLQTYKFGGLILILTVIGTVLLFNTYYFLFNKEKQDEYYERFCELKNPLGSIIVGVYIILIFTLTIWIATKHREKNLEMKQQTQLSEVCSSKQYGEVFNFVV